MKNNQSRNKNNCSNSKQNGRKPTKREQPRKDSKSKRLNLDNERVSKFEKDVTAAGGNTDNDVRWYANSPELLRSAASIPFSSYTGMAFPNAANVSVPGIYAIHYAPYVGSELDSNPINQAANSVYSYVVHANSRNQTYDAPDLMMLTLAGMQVFSALALGIRAYGTMKSYSQLDRYTPQGLIEAMGFDFQDLNKNLNKMWFDLNRLIAMSKQIWIPNAFPVMERWYWLNTNIYMDAQSAKSQYYLFVPSVFYVYDETSSDKGGILTPYLWSMSGLTSNSSFPPVVLKRTWEFYVNMVDTMISALINSQDRGIIFGDILKAYGPERLYALPEIGPDYTVTPVYNPEVLTQIENSTCFPCNFQAYSADDDINTLDPTNTYFGDIVQNPENNNLISQNFQKETVKSNALAKFNSKGLDYSVLNFHLVGVPTPEMIMVATRLTTLGISYHIGTQVSSGTENYYFVNPAHAGTEVVTGYVTSVYNPVSHEFVQRYNSNMIPNGTSVDEIDLFRWAACDWAPAIYKYQPGTLTDLPTQNTPNYLKMLRADLDYENYTFLDHESLNKMHITAVYSEFGVPVSI